LTGCTAHAVRNGNDFACNGFARGGFACNDVVYGTHFVFLDFNHDPLGNRLG